jgi:hypothetical protein
MRELLREIAVDRKGQTLLARLYRDLTTQELSVDVYASEDERFVRRPNMFSTVRLTSAEDFEREVSIQIAHAP